MTERKYRRYVNCACLDCGSNFKRRSDYKNKDRCTKCSIRKAAEKQKTHGHSNSNSRLHVTWSNMKRRCLNPTKKEKINYCGVKLFDEWMDYKPFMDWAMENGYRDDLTIDRKDNSKGYSPSNCRFVTYSHQNANRRITSKNKTGYIGVSVHKKTKYRAVVTWKRRQIFNAYFDDPESAAIARDRFIIDNALPHTLNDIKQSKEPLKTIKK